MDLTELELREEKRIKGIKAFWANKSPEEKKIIMGPRGSKGGKSKWAKMNKKERLDVITKLTKSRI